MQMPKFTYRSGQRPLDGFTIKRGVGQGGFGEVYFAISDGGKEVALKLLHKHAEIELRGVEPCLNIKHPNLLHIYDLRIDSRGNHWLVMEYILGESLAQLLDREPNGLPTDLARDWFLALCRAVNHLHEHGIVHRDLKPANIFIEQGQLKVGDYGLCKALSESRAGHSSTIGTVHYMAPEISRGEYNKQIDIYACGIILYEMLTGRLPFDGESYGEILLKHLTDTPDYTGVPDVYKPILHKALDKNPARRYATITEMMRAVENLSRPKPVYLSATLASSATIESLPPLQKAVPSPPSKANRAVRLKDPPTSIPLTPREKAAELTASLACVPVLAALPVLLYQWYWQTSDLTTSGQMYAITIALFVAILVPAKLWKFRDTSLTPRILMATIGIGIGVGAFWLHGWTPRLSFSRWNESPWAAIGITEAGRPLFIGYVAFFAIVFGGVRWWKCVARERADRVSVFPALVASLVGGVALLTFQGVAVPGSLVMVLVAVSLLVQVISPWQPIVTSPPPRKLRLLKAQTPILNPPLDKTLR